MDYKSILTLTIGLFTILISTTSLIISILKVDYTDISVNFNNPVAYIQKIINQFCKIFIVGIGVDTEVCLFTIMFKDFNEIVHSDIWVILIIILILPLCILYYYFRYKHILRIIELDQKYIVIGEDENNLFLLTHKDINNDTIYFLPKNNYTENESLYLVIGTDCKKKLKKVIKSFDEANTEIKKLNNITKKDQYQIKKMDNLKIIKIKDNITIYGNGGKNKGITVGEKFEIIGNGKQTIEDPETEEILGYEPIKKGIVIADEVYEKYTIFKSEYIEPTYDSIAGLIISPIINEINQTSNGYYKTLDVDSDEIYDSVLESEPIHIGDELKPID